MPVSGKDMIWLTIIPDDKSRCIGAYFLPNRRVSVWYVDVIEGIGMDEDGDTPLDRCTLSSSFPISHLVFTAFEKGEKAERYVWYPLRGENSFARFNQPLDFLKEDERYRRFVEKYEKITLSVVVGSGHEFTVFKGKPSL